MEKYVFYAMGEEKPKPVKIEMENHDIGNYDKMITEANEKIREANPNFRGPIIVFGFGDV